MTNLYQAEYMSELHRRRLIELAEHERLVRQFESGEGVITQARRALARALVATAARIDCQSVIGTMPSPESCELL